MSAWWSILLPESWTAVHEQIAGRFGRAEPRARVRVREYVCGLVAGLERKNGWTLAEHAGEACSRPESGMARVWGDGEEPLELLAGDQAPSADLEVVDVPLPDLVIRRVAGTGRSGGRPRRRSDLLHQQRRDAAGVLYRADRAAPGRAANSDQRVKRGPLGRSVRGPGYTMDQSMRIRINDFLAHHDLPVAT